MSDIQKLTKRINVPVEIKTEYLVNFRLQHYKDEPVNNDRNIRADRNNKVVDFEAKNKRNAVTGSKGEELVLCDEKHYLKSIGRSDLADQVKRISIDNVSAGYDILSYDKDGNEKKIEVKTSTLPKSTKFSFRISSNEKKVAEESTNYWIYLVFDVNSNSPKIASIKNPFTLEGLFSIEPTQYLMKGQSN